MDAQEEVVWSFLAALERRDLATARDCLAPQGVRFVDRFEFAGGLIVRQDVWNDLADVRP